MDLEKLRSSIRRQLPATPAVVFGRRKKPDGVSPISARRYAIISSKCRFFKVMDGARRYGMTG